MYRLVLLFSALALSMSAKAESFSMNFQGRALNALEPLSSDNFIYPASLYKVQNGRVLTNGNATADGRAAKPALLKNWQMINSKQTMVFSLDRSARLTIASLRARESSDGWYEAAAFCSPGHFGGRGCRAFVVRAKLSGTTLTEKVVSNVIPLSDDNDKKTMTFQIEDVYEDSGSKVTRVLLIVNDRASDTLDATTLTQANANPLYGRIGGLGFMLQGGNSSIGVLTETAVYSYAAEYLPHQHGRMCYTSAGSLERCSQNATLKAFTVALPSEQVPGLSMIYKVANPNLPESIRYYQTQSYGESVYLVSLGYIAHGGFGNALPAVHCAGTGKEIVHRYEHQSGRHVFASNTNTRLGLASGSQWVTHTSLACSLE